MNNFLADLLGLINGFLALIVIFVGTLIGAFYDPSQVSAEFNLVGAVLGALAGFGVAAVIFGTLAILISIRRELKLLNRNLARDVRPTPRM
jgi:prepilin signal peptidase PulO-like enzyme (type II secretory pathway)